jgi:hypothetical protein
VVNSCGGWPTSAPPSIRTLVHYVNQVVLFIRRTHACGCVQACRCTGHAACMHATRMCPAYDTHGPASSMLHATRMCPACNTQVYLPSMSHTRACQHAKHNFYIHPHATRPSNTHTTYPGSMLHRHPTHYMSIECPTKHIMSSQVSEDAANTTDSSTHLAATAPQPCLHINQCPGIDQRPCTRCMLVRLLLLLLFRRR